MNPILDVLAMYLVDPSLSFSLSSPRARIVFETLFYRGLDQAAMYGSCGSQAPPRFHVRIHPIVYAQREVRRDYRLVRTNEIHERVVIRTSAFLGTHNATIASNHLSSGIDAQRRFDSKGFVLRINQRMRIVSRYRHVSEGKSEKKGRKRREIEIVRSLHPSL